ncbi:membrane dipeptidase [Bordetella sp. 15P40C-2]|uniref:dipeptidase n=1 Tax=Bordetella sp. 15P40C-2 TaxID=2572246 RepID=UPI0013209025|nr:dipeptidase [Bordetella sp. 15P40C-2]
MNSSAQSQALHDRSIVIDGLIYFSDGDASDLLAGGVTAANVTVSDYRADPQRAFDEVCEWRERLRQPGCPWKLVLNAEDIVAAKAQGKVGLIMGWQSMRPIEDRIERIEAFAALGVRVMQLTYNEANYIGDACLEARNSGLTNFGIEAIARMNEVGVAVDLSHCGEQTTLDAAKYSKKPVLLTHANASALQPRKRNKSDEAIKAVANSGGMIGISVHGFLNWEGDPQRPPSMEGFINNVKHVGKLVGYDHVGIGTDYPSVRSYDAVRHVIEMGEKFYAKSGGDFSRAFGHSVKARYPEGFDSARKMSNITAALLDAGINESDVEKIIGGNFLRILGEIWGG